MSRPWRAWWDSWRWRWAVTALRSAVREGKVLPLLESPVEDDGDDDADDED